MTKRDQFSKVGWKTLPKLYQISPVFIFSQLMTQPSSSADAQTARQAGRPYH
jgi:hypothetical protein